MKDAGEAQGGSQAASSTIQHRLIKQQEGKAAIAKRNLAVGGQKHHHHHGPRNGSVAVAPDGVKRQKSVAMTANRNAAAGVLDEEDGSAEGSEQRQTITGVAQHRLREGPPSARFPPPASRMVSSSSSSPPPPPLLSSSSMSSLQQRSREQLLLSAIRQENEARLLAALQLQRSMARQGQVPLDGSAASFLQQTEQAPVSQASSPLALQRYLAGTLAGTGRRGEQQQLRSPNHEGDHADGLIAAAVAARREASMMSSLSALRERLVLEKIFELEQQQRSDDALLASYLRGLGSRGHPQHGGDHDRAQLVSLLLRQEQQQQKQRQLSSLASSSQSALIRSLATGYHDEDTTRNQGELSQPDPVGSVLIRDRLARTNLGMIDKLRQIAPRTVLESSSASAGSASIPSRVQSSTHAAVNPNVASSPSS
mmetsp:Transcript_5323/g.15616  ORF Transcript_5323/g.15616 Transcript_5323/m.15616 type:complete len:425 (+) Transcript_5323:1129-2403(+)